MRGRALRPSARGAGQRAARAPRVRPPQSATATLMTRTPPGNALRGPTVPHVLMRGRPPLWPAILHRARGGAWVGRAGACLGPTPPWPPHGTGRGATCPSGRRPGVRGADTHAPGAPGQRGGVRRSRWEGRPARPAGGGADAGAPRPAPPAHRPRGPRPRGASAAPGRWEAPARWARGAHTAGPCPAQDARALAPSPPPARDPDGSRRGAPGGAPGWLGRRADACQPGTGRGRSRGRGRRLGGRPWAYQGRVRGTTW
jgi:hypothetical protein